MDPFSITVGALGITEFALSSISNLRCLLVGLREAKDVMQDMISGLEAVQRPLSALKDLPISDCTTYVEAKENLNRIGVAEAVNKCGQACADFSKKLEQWTKHSNAQKISLRDRLSIGLWNKERIRTFRTQVHSCQAIVQFAIESAQLIILVRSENASKNAQQETHKQLRNLEIAIQEYIESTTRNNKKGLQRKKEMESPEDEDEDGGAQQTLAIQEIGEQSRLLEAYRNASEIVSRILSDLLVRKTSNNNIIDFSGSRNWGIQCEGIGYLVGQCQLIR